MPPAAWYDGYPQYYDGIGMIRSYLDDTASTLHGEAARIERIGRELSSRSLTLTVVSGEAARETIAGFVEREPLCGQVVAIKNRYFGGNVDVTGLICACDLIDQLEDDLAGVMLFLPDVMFNADGLTLDGYHRDDVLETLERRGAIARVASSLPLDLLGAIEDALGV